MKYILFVDDTPRVAEIIPDENPIFPGIPIGQRYSAEFVKKLFPVEDDVEVEQNWEYNEQTGTFALPVLPEISMVEETENEDTNKEEGIEETPQ